jgi:hypothetical protein
MQEEMTNVEEMDYGAPGPILESPLESVKKWIKTFGSSKKNDLMELYDNITRFILDDAMLRPISPQYVEKTMEKLYKIRRITFPDDMVIELNSIQFSIILNRYDTLWELHSGFVSLSNEKILINPIKIITPNGDNMEIILHPISLAWMFGSIEIGMLLIEISDPGQNISCNHVITEDNNIITLWESVCLTPDVYRQTKNIDFLERIVATGLEGVSKQIWERIFGTLEERHGKFLKGGIVINEHAAIQNFYLYLKIIKTDSEVCSKSISKRFARRFGMNKYIKGIPDMDEIINSVDGLIVGGGDLDVLPKNR